MWRKKIKFEITTMHIAKGKPNCPAHSPLAMALEDAGCEWALVSPTEAYYCDPYGAQRRANVSGMNQEWLRLFDAGERVPPRKMALRGARCDDPFEGLMG